jgi:hypothetical protein
MLKTKFFILIVLIASSYIISEDCYNFNGENGCQGNQTEYPSEWSNRIFQTPPRNDPLWKVSYQDMHLLTGYVSIRYNNPEKTEATLVFETNVNSQKVISPELVYHFGEIKQSNNSFVVTQNMETKNGILL